MRRIASLLFLILAFSSATFAQQRVILAKAVTACSGESYTVGTIYTLTIDTTGALCVSADFSGDINIDTAGLATSTKQSDGSQKTQIVDAGGEATTVTGGKLDVNATLDTTGLSTSAKQDTGNTQLIAISGKLPTALGTGGGLKVDGSGTALPVSGTVTVTDGSGSLNTIVDSGTITAVTTITNPVTVTDGSGALNVICDSGCASGGGTIGSAVPSTGFYEAVNVGGTLRGLTATIFGSTGYAADVNIASGTVTVTDGAGSLNTIVDSGTITTITNPVTITDGAGSLNTIVDSGTITAVTTITNPVTVTDGSGALNVICDSGCSISGSATGSAVPSTATYIAGNVNGGTLRGITATVFGTTGYGLDVNVAAGIGDDAAENNAPTTDPVPLGVVYRTAPPTLTAGNIGYARGDVNGNQVVVGNGTAGTAAGGVMTVQGVASMTPLLATGTGTAGTAATGVLSIQGIASMTAVQTDLTKIGSVSALACATSGCIVAAPAQVFTPSATIPGPGGMSTGLYSVQTVNTNGELRTVQADCGDPGMVSSVVITTSGIGQTQLVALTSGQTIYVCGWNVMANGTTNVNLSYGTGVQCGTSNVALTGAYPLIAQTGLVLANAGAMQTKAAVSNALCVNNSAAIAIAGMLTYVKRQ